MILKIMFGIGMFFLCVFLAMVIPNTLTTSADGINMIRSVLLIFGLIGLTYSFIEK